MKISDILLEENIKIPVQSTDKESALNELWSLVKGSDDVIDSDQVLKAILEREKRETTGVGQGIAIPHGKCTAVNNILAVLGLSEKGIEFDSLDEKPVHIVFMLIAPQEKAGLYLKSLSRISRLLNNEEFRQKLISAKNSAEALSYLKEEEDKYFDIK